MSYAKDRAEFITIMTSEGMSEGIAKLILRDASTIQRFAVYECNRELSKAEQTRYWMAQARIRVRCASYDVTGSNCRITRFEAVIGGDPRGACVKIKVPSGRTNDWGNTGICVPTRSY